MQTGYISFCDSTAFNIKTENTKKKILKDVYNISNIKIVQKHFDVLNSNHFSKLNDNPHLISLKSNGNPYLLFFTQYNFTNLSIFIDKKIQSGYFLPRMIISRFQFNDELYSNTLLEGEMVKDNNNKWIFIINDVYIHKNKSLLNVNISKRLAIINNIVSEFKYDNDDVCKFRIKKYFKYDKLRYMVEGYKETLNYTCRGIYFTPLFFKFKNILFNFDDSLINDVKKVKYQNNGKFLLLNENNISNKILHKKNKNIIELENHTENHIENHTENYIENHTENHTKEKIDDKNCKVFYVEKTDMPDVFYLNNNINDNSNNIAYIPNITSSLSISNYFKDVNLNNKIKMNCIYNSKFKKWQPIDLIKT